MHFTDYNKRNIFAIVKKNNFTVPFLLIPTYEQTKKDWSFEIF
jgi:hypothetical protein